MLENLNKRIEKYGLHFTPNTDMRHGIVCLLEKLEEVVDRKEDRIKTLEEEMRMIREFLAL